MTGSYDWIAWTAGGFVGLLGVYLALRALLVDGFRRRWHKQRRCPKCWYDMRHTPGATCSECGFTAKRERQLFKARRRWRWVAVALLLIAIGWGGGVYPKARRDGWRSVVPTTVLIAALPWLDEPETPIEGGLTRVGPQGATKLRSLHSELTCRAKDDLLWDWQWHWLARRSCAGDAARRPPSQRWHDTYRRLLNSAIGAGHPWDDRMLPALAVADIAVRHRWPADQPLQARCIIERRYSHKRLEINELLVQIAPRIPGLSPVEKRLSEYLFSARSNDYVWRLPARSCWQDPTPGELTTLGSVPCGTTHIDFDISFGQIDEETGIAEPIWSTVVRTPIDVVETTADALVAVQAPAVEEAIRTELDLDEWYIVPRAIGFEHAIAALADLAPITLAVTIEFVDGEEVMFSASAWWSVRRAPDSTGAADVAVTPATPWVWLRMTHETSRPIWTRGRAGSDIVSLRIRSDPAVALRNFDCDRYWVGEVTIPLRWSDEGQLVPDQGARGGGE
ncbi:MAG: hypothetical protein KAS72_05585 [Phycisphaerales bacterium]|nr:hypothetical protein [Phycisphaerales bacterium]